MAEARDNTRGRSVRIRHIPIHNEGDGGLFAPLAYGQRGKQTAVPSVVYWDMPNRDGLPSVIFSAFGGVPSGPACSPVGIVPLWLGPFGERACWRDVGLLVVSGFAGGKSFAGEALFEFCW